MIGFTLEQFNYGKHLSRVALMEPDVLSSEVMTFTGLQNELGFTKAQVLMDALIGSDEAFVFLDRKTNTVVGAFGVAQKVCYGTIMCEPWLYSNGFHKHPSNTAAFLRVLKTAAEDWRRQAPHRTFIGIVPNRKESSVLLKHLGFSVITSGDRITFTRKGKEVPHYDTSLNGSAPSGHIPSSDRRK